MVGSLYPIGPWVGVMMAGYAAGELLTWAPARRGRTLVRLGWVSTAGFVLLRASNLYGDPSPWSHRGSALFNLMSFLNCTKYPHRSFFC